MSYCEDPGAKYDCYEYLLLSQKSTWLGVEFKSQLKRERGANGESGTRSDQVKRCLRKLIESGVSSECYSAVQMNGKMIEFVFYGYLWMSLLKMACRALMFQLHDQQMDAIGCLK